MTPLTSGSARTGATPPHPQHAQAPAQLNDSHLSCPHPPVPRNRLSADLAAIEATGGKLPTRKPQPAGTRYQADAIMI